MTHVADMAYLGQIHALRVPIELGWAPQRMAKAFVDQYAHEFGNTLGDIPVVLVNLRTTAAGIRRAKAPQMERMRATGSPRPSGRRKIYFGNAWYDTAIYSRDALAPGHLFDGPAIIEQRDTTTVVEPDMRLTVDIASNLLVGVK